MKMDKNINFCCGLCDSLDKNDEKHTYSSIDKVYRCKKHLEYVSVNNKICPPQLCDYIDLKEYIKI